MQGVLDAVQAELASQDDRITIRHLFYRLVGQGHIPKTEAGYKGLCSHLAKWRRSGDVEWDAFSDSTRWRIGSPKFDSAADSLASTAACYRRNLWADQAVYMEIWTEKDAIASILAPVADSFGVSVFVCRGFSSLSSLYAGANIFRQAQQAGKYVQIVHFGDHDPSGAAIDKAVVSALRDDFGVEVFFERAAVIPEQIRAYGLPTRPTKQSDSRARTWNGGESVEVDAMPMGLLRDLVRDYITDNIEGRAWAQMQAVEREEKATLEQISAAFRKGEA